MNDIDLLIIRALLRASDDCKVRHVPSGSRRILIPYQAVFRDAPISRSSLFDEEGLWLQEETEGTGSVHPRRIWREVQYSGGGWVMDFWVGLVIMLSIIGFMLAVELLLFDNS